MPFLSHGDIPRGAWAWWPQAGTPQAWQTMALDLQHLRQIFPRTSKSWKFKADIMFAKLGGDTEERNNEDPKARETKGPISCTAVKGWSSH